MPKAYLIANVDITDPETYESYKARNPEIFGRHGGKFLVRGGTQNVVEGDAKSRTVILEFPSFEAAQAAYDDPDYVDNRQTRFAASDTGFAIIVEGAE